MNKLYNVLAWNVTCSGSRIFESKRRCIGINLPFDKALILANKFLYLYGNTIRCKLEEVK